MINLSAEILFSLLIMYLFMLYMFIIMQIDNSKDEIIKHIRTTDPLLRRLDAQTRRIK